MGRARECFDRLCRDSSAVRVTISEQEDSYFVDVMAAETSTTAASLSKADLDYLATSISGFANSEGGVIIWANKQDPATDGKSSSHQLSEILNPHHFRQLIQDASGGVTLPMHANIQSAVIAGDLPDRGFVVTFVPPGHHIPYQALYPTPNYFLRAGSAFIFAPHNIIAALFGRPPQSQVVSKIALSTIAALNGDTVRVNLPVSMRNIGRGVAEDIFCIVEPNVGRSVAVNFSLLGQADFTGWRTVDAKQNYFTILLNELRLPPTTEQAVFETSVEIRAVDAGGIAINFETGSRNGPGAAARVELPDSLISEIYAHFLRPLPREKGEDARLESVIKSCLPILTE